MKTFVAIAVLILTTLVQAAPPVMLVPAEEDSTYKQFLPRLEAADYDRILVSDDLIFYTEDVVPRVYQNSNHFLSAYYNIAALPDPFGNGNREFPWNVAMGTDNVEHSLVVRFLQLPKKPDGTYWPIVHFNQDLPGDLRDYITEFGRSSWQWVYPKGTVFGELLAFQHDDYTYPYELRLRIKGDGAWNVEVFRPCPTAADLVREIQTRRPNWADVPELRALVEHLSRDQVFPQEQFQDRAGTAFRAAVAVDNLPPLGDDQLAKEILLQTAWPSALGQAWREGPQGQQVFAPTTDSDEMHIVPRHYSAHMLLADSQSCARCHEHTNLIVAHFEPDREWYGRIRGSDGILSFHPLEPAASNVSTFVAPRIRQIFLEKNLVERYSQTRHPADRYRMVPLFPPARGL